MIRYAGVDLCLEDPEGRLMAMMDRFLSVDDMKAFGCEPGHRYVQKGHNIHYANYTPPSAVRFNELHMPTGATRWAYFFGLVTKSQLDEIIEEIGEAANTPALLEMESSFQPESITHQMYLLPPRPLSARAAPNSWGPDELQYQGDQLWVLPLVDVRYYWQWRHVGEISDQSFSTPTDLITYLADKISVTIDESISGEYVAPAVSDQNNDFLPVPVFLETVALETQTRFVRSKDKDDDGNFKWEFIDVDTCLGDNRDGRLWDNLNAPAGRTLNEQVVTDLVMGDFFGDIQTSAAIPEKLLVVFPQSGGSGYFQSIHNATDQVKVTSDTVRVIRSSVEHSSDTVTEISDHATQLATDFYEIAETAYDMTFAGLVPWDHCVWDDEIIWSQRRLAMPRVIDDTSGQCGTYQDQTRVRSLPYDHDWAPVRGMGDTVITDGLVDCELGNGYYRIELATLTVELDDESCPSSSVEGACDDWNECPDPLAACPTFPRPSPAGTGRYVVALDVAALPLQAGVHVVLGLVGSSDLGSSASISSAGGSADYRILRAYVEPQCLDWVTAWKCETDCDGNFTGNIVASSMRRAIGEFILCGECSVNVLSCSSSSA